MAMISALKDNILHPDHLGGLLEPLGRALGVWRWAVYHLAVHNVQVSSGAVKVFHLQRSYLRLPVALQKIS